MSFKFYSQKFLLLFLLFVSLSCATIKEFASMQKPTARISDFKVTNFSLQDIELTFDMEVDNPNPVTVALSQYDYDLQLNSQSLVKGSQPTNSSVEASAKSVVQIPVSFGFKDLYNLASSLKDKDETDFNFAANAEIDVPILGKITIPVNKTGTLPVVKFPSINVGSVKVSKLSFTKIDLEVQVDIDNPNSFDLNFDNLNYNFALNGIKAISGKSENTINVLKKSGSKLTLPISLNLFELGSEVRKALVDGKPFEYSITGNADVGSSLPIFKTSAFDFDKSGVVDILK